MSNKFDKIVLDAYGTLEEAIPGAAPSQQPNPQPAPQPAAAPAPGPAPAPTAPAPPAQQGQQPAQAPTGDAAEAETMLKWALAADPAAHGVDMNLTGDDFFSAVFNTQKPQQ